MADSKKPSDQINDEDLLANAIPIENMDEEEVQEVEEVQIEEISAQQAAAETKAEETKPIDVDDQIKVEHREIRTFDTHKVLDVSDKWARRPDQGMMKGASHCRTFVAKLRMDAIEHLDHQINEWLDRHPEFEVKNATVTTGILSGKLREEALFMTIWV